ncbi:MAG: (Fe-S)-binding protein, partial [Thermodesulfobacteriota bacterium]|nr:(Fe-S)-binding protein [Thermodesulfobacteriota bacterium]
KWAEGMKIPENAEVMLFVGCISSYKSREIAKAAANILKTAGITFGILKDEWCCGMKVLNAGSCNSGKKVAKHNVTALRKAGAKTVIMQCGECYKGFKIDYPEMIGELPFEVLHITQFIKKLINEGKINLTEQIRKKVTYHDPCALGRFSGVYDEPREILKMIPGTELVEMYPAKEYAWCCGGSIKDAYPDLAVKIAVDRVNHAHEVGAEVLTSACPLCKINIQDAIKKTDTDLVFYDIIEIIAKAAGL